MRKILVSLLALFLLGIALRVSLPSYSANVIDVESYQVNQSSLFNPLPMKAFLLVTPIPKDARFTLRLGLYSDLQVATDNAELIETTKRTSIVKTVEHYREWYLLLHGRYDSRERAQQDQQWLKNNHVSATLMLWPDSLE